MTIHTIHLPQHTVACVQSDAPLITNAQSALDLIANVRYQTEADTVLLQQSALTRDFFVLSTGLAGEVLQKFINYQMKLAIVGDFSGYTSKPLHDFIYESNQGKDVFFASSNEDALQKISAAV